MGAIYREAWAGEVQQPWNLHIWEAEAGGLQLEAQPGDLVT